MPPHRRGRACRGGQAEASGTRWVSDGCGKLRKGVSSDQVILTWILSGEGLGALVWFFCVPTLETDCDSQLPVSPLSRTPCSPACHLLNPFSHPLPQVLDDASGFGERQGWQ